MSLVADWSRQGFYSGATHVQQGAVTMIIPSPGVLFSFLLLILFCLSIKNWDIGHVEQVQVEFLVQYLTILSFFIVYGSPGYCFSVQNWYMRAFIFFLFFHVLSSTFSCRTKRAMTAESLQWVLSHFSDCWKCSISLLTSVLCDLCL